MTSLANLHSELSLSPYYMGSPNVSNNIMWVRDSRGHIVVDKTSKKESVGVVVSCVDPQKLNCGPDGNHIRADISPFAKAKFQFQLCQPFESPFAQDFDAVIQMLENIQGKIAQTGDRRNMIVSDMNSKLIRFTCNVFEQRIRKQRIPKHAVYLADLESVNAGEDGRGARLQAAIEYSPSKHKDEFESMKFDFMACPLRVYRDKIFVELRDVNEALTGAVVEVSFAIRHYYLRDKKFDTFQTDIQQINIRIVKPGGSIATSVFKRRNAREGPLNVIKITSTTGKDKEEGREKGEIRWRK